MAVAPPSSYEAIVFGRPDAGWRRRWFAVIFESDTPSGRRFDLALPAVIVASVVVVMQESVEPLASRNATLVPALEWSFTLFFTVEYIARLLCVKRPLRYPTSFFGLVDLTSVLPMYRPWSSLYASRRKITVFVSVVAMLVVVLGTIMYVLEWPQNGFTSIPVAIDWAITTMTTVAFGDIAPQTNLGRAVSSIVMLLRRGSSRCRRAS